MCRLPAERNFQIAHRNIQGLHRCGECKIAEYSKECLSDIEILTETWGCDCPKDFEGYALLAELKPQKQLGVKKGRKSGGVLVLAKSHLKKHVKVKILENFVCVEIDRGIIENFEKNLFVLGCYIHDTTSKYFDPNAFDNLAMEISKICDENTPLILTGDFNGRTGEVDDTFEESQDIELIIKPQPPYSSLPHRKNCDNVINQQGRSILELCQILDLRILNGRSLGDPIGNFTYFNANLGASTIDYSLCSQNLYENVKNFMVLPQNELSDHSKIVTELKCRSVSSNVPVDDYDWGILEKPFRWDDSLKLTFNRSLEDELVRIADIEQRLEAGLVDSAGKNLAELFNQTASKVFGKSVASSENIGIKNSRNRKHNEKKWFDTGCAQLKQEVRKLGRSKGKTPKIIF